jgi:hypothetical protein
MRVAGGASRALRLGLVLLLVRAAAASAGTPRLLLHADFDHEPSCLSQQVGSQPGVGGRGAALLLDAGAECAFPGAEHWSSRAGTLSFWARPHDWSDGEGRHQVLFSWSGRARGRPFHLYVDSPAEPGVVRLVVAFGGGGDPRQQLFRIHAPASWQAGRWQKVDVTWNEREIVLHANGRAGEHLALESIELPDPAGSRLALTPAPATGVRDATAIDELEIWDAAFPADRIAKRYRAEVAPPLAEPRLRAPRVAAAPALDGRLDDATWARATRVPVLPDAETGAAGLLVPHAWFAWGEQALWVALQAPLTGAEDALELTLAPAGGGAARSLRVTPRGLAGGDASGAAGLEAAVRSADESFAAELAVPFAALGIEPAPGAQLRLDLRHRPAAPGSLGVGARLAGAALTLGDESEGVRLSLGPELALGRLVGAIERDGGAQATLEVAAPDGRPWRERIEVRGRRRLDESPDAAEGVLRLAVRGEPGRELVALESRLAPLQLPGLLPVPEPESRTLAVELDLGWLDGSWLRALAAGTAQARLVEQGPEGGEAHALAPFAERASVRLGRGLAPGTHTLALELRSPERALRFERSLEVPELPWLATPLAGTDGVLEPWLPLAWDDDATLRVWGRRYRFDGPLLAEVGNATGALLRAPMTLRLATGAGEAAFRTLSAELTGRSAARADFAGTGVFEGSGVDVSWSAWIEYDGVVLSSFTLRPRAAGTRVEGLELDIPVHPRIARYLRGMQHGSTIRRGRTPWNGRRFQSAFEPLVWLSNEDEGFLYFAESAANWVGADRAGAVTVRGGADAGIRLRLIGEPAVLPGPVTFTLGFQATPVKPELPQARDWNFGVAGTPTPNETAIAWFAEYAIRDGLWQLDRPSAIREREGAFASRGARPFYYATTSATPDDLPAFRLFEPLWRSAWSYSYGGQRAKPDNGMRGDIPQHRLAAVCPADASFQRKMLDDAAALLRLGVLGLYTDTDEIFADDNPRHGCGYRDAFGRRGVTWSILGKRRFAGRLAALLREGGARRFWLTHAHTRLVPPVHGFADFWYPGEELTGKLRSDPWFYTDALDEVAWRVEYRGASSGIVHVFLPEFARGSGDPKDPALRAPTESLLAMAAVNDVNVSAAYAHPETVGEFWGLRRKLGLIDAEFVGHWEPGCPVRALQPDARASLYRTKHGPVVAVANRAPHAQRVELRLDLAGLGLGAHVEARDARRGEPLALEGDRLSVPLEARSYSYLTLLPGGPAGHR